MSVHVCFATANDNTRGREGEEEGERGGRGREGEEEGERGNKMGRYRKVTPSSRSHHLHQRGVAPD